MKRTIVLYSLSLAILPCQAFCRPIRRKSAFKKDTTYFSPSEQPFMFNYRVENLVELLEVLKEEGVQPVGEIQEYPYGKFGWIMDPEGNKIEHWEPKDDVL